MRLNIIFKIILMAELKLSLFKTQEVNSTLDSSNTVIAELSTNKLISSKGDVIIGNSSQFITNNSTFSDKIEIEDENRSYNSPEVIFNVSTSFPTLRKTTNIILERNRKSSNPNYSIEKRINDFNAENRRKAAAEFIQETLRTERRAKLASLRAYSTTENLIEKKVTQAALINNPTTNIISSFVVNPNIQICYVDFELLINEFVNFEAKTGLVELDANLKFKWWEKDSDTSDEDNVEINDEIDSKNSKIIDINEYFNKKDDLRSSNRKFNYKNYYPSIEFKDKSVKLNIKNQVHHMDDIQVLTEKNFDSQEKILAKFEKFKSSNNEAVAAALMNNKYDDIYMSKEGFSNSSSSSKKIIRHYSSLEQNVTIKFNCKSAEYNPYSPYLLDKGFDAINTIRFPFDAHLCELDFDLIPLPIFSKFNKSPFFTNNLAPVYLFSTRSINNKAARIEIDDKLIDFFNYNKLVQTTDKNSWISKEWLLKKLTVFYVNSTSPYLPLKNHQQNDFGNLNQTANKIDHILVSKKELIKLNNNISLTEEPNTQKLKSRRSLEGNTTTKQVTKKIASNSRLLRPSGITSTPASINLRFLIQRRREPQVYVFVLPLVLFTVVTFLIFFLPTSNTSEKTLIAFLNFSCLLGYNIYLFKLVVHTYEFMRIPLILQYSNCLMIIQLGVLAYTCLVKSVYQYGFLTFGSGSYLTSFEDSIKHTLFMSSEPNQLLDIFNLVGNTPHSKPKITNTNTIEKIKNDENDMIIYHGLEKIESQTECMVNTSNANNIAGTCAVSDASNFIDRCILMNRSSKSVKITMPIIKLDDSDGTLNEGESKNTNNSTEENNFVAYNHIESSIGPATSQRCGSSSVETDVDCCQTENNPCIGNINSGAGTPSSSNEPDANKLITIRNDLIVNHSNCNMSYQGQELKFVSGKTTTSSTDFPNKNNWMLTKLCCGTNSSGSKVAPMNMIENKCTESQKQFQKKSFPSSYCISSATTRQLLPECDYASHLCRIKEPVFNGKKIFNHENIFREQSPVAASAIQLNNLSGPSNKFSINQSHIRNSFTNPQLNTNMRKPKNHNDLATKILDNASFEMTKLNLGVQKLVKMEEVYVKERILREEWRRKARLCDGICCLLVFFLLVICSTFIFLILPTVKTASLID